MGGQRGRPREGFVEETRLLGSVSQVFQAEETALTEAWDHLSLCHGVRNDNRDRRGLQVWQVELGPEAES